MSERSSGPSNTAANRQEFMRQVDPEHNPDYVMGPGDEVPRLATDEEREQLGLPARGAAPRRCVGEFRLADEEMTRRCEKPHGHRGDCGSKDAFRSKDSLSAACRHTTFIVRGKWAKCMSCGHRWLDFRLWSSRAR